jgi:hypothetical protein
LVPLPDVEPGAISQEEVLPGGVDNAGGVVRIGDEVLRPARDHTSAAFSLLDHLRSAGFDGAPRPLGRHPDGRERLTYIAGQVPLPPFPRWFLTDAALASTTVLLRRFHDASLGFVLPAGATWNEELADPEGGDVICHNDVCPENVVFRDGLAVALLDFDFAAPGRRTFDLATFARMFVPLDSPEEAARSGRSGLDPFKRLRIVADSYGLETGRTELVELAELRLAAAHEFVRRRVDEGDPAFTRMWNERGGDAMYERRRQWFQTNRERLFEAVG